MFGYVNTNVGEKLELKSQRNPYDIQWKVIERFVNGQNFFKVENSVKIIELYDELENFHSHLYEAIVKTIYDKLSWFKKNPDFNIDELLNSFKKISQFIFIGEQLFFLYTRNYLMIHTQTNSFRNFVYKILNTEVFKNLYQDEQFYLRLFNIITDIIEKPEFLKNQEQKKSLSEFFQMIQNLNLMSQFKNLQDQIFKKQENSIKSQANFYEGLISSIENYKLQLEIFPNKIQVEYFEDFYQFLVLTFRKELFIVLRQNFLGLKYEETLKVFEIFKITDKIDIVKDFLSEIISFQLEKCLNFQQLLDFNEWKKQAFEIIKEEKSLIKMLEMGFINDLNNKNRFTPEMLAEAFDITFQQQNINQEYQCQQLLYILKNINQNLVFVKPLFNKFLSRTIKQKQISEFDKLLIQEFQRIFGYEQAEKFVYLQQCLQNNIIYKEQDFDMNFVVLQPQVWSFEENNQKLTFNYLPTPFQQIITQNKINFESQNKRKILHFLEENNTCEFEVNYQGKTIQIISTIWQSLLIKECIDSFPELSLSVLEFKYKVKFQFLQSIFQKMNEIIEIFNISNDYVSINFDKLQNNQKIDFTFKPQKQLKDLPLIVFSQLTFDKEKYFQKKNKHIQSYIVNFVKNKKKVDIDLILSFVKQKLNIDILVNTDIEEILEDLIEKDLIERDEMNQNLFLYCQQIIIMGQIISKQNFGVLILGPKSSGKTTFLIEMINKDREKSSSIQNTYGFNIEEFETKKGVFQICEIGGHQDIIFLEKFF